MNWYPQYANGGFIPKTNNMELHTNPNLIGTNFVITDILGKQLYSGKIQNSVQYLPDYLPSNAILFVRILAPNQDVLKFYKN